MHILSGSAAVVLFAISALVTIPGALAADTQRCRSQTFLRDRPVVDINPMIMNWGPAVEYAKQFCRQGEFTKRYGGGSPVAMEFSVIAPPGRDHLKFKMEDAPQCESKFIDGLIHGCDSKVPGNALNTKWGGSLFFSGWTYTLTPLSSPKPAARVHFNKPKEDRWIGGVTFDIKGRMFDMEKFGSSGAGFNNRVRRACGQFIYDWEWKLTPEDGEWQWEGRGSVDNSEKMRKCLVRRVSFAGGPADVERVDD